MIFLHIKIFIGIFSMYAFTKIPETLVQGVFLKSYILNYTIFLFKKKKYI